MTVTYHETDGVDRQSGLRFQNHPRMQEEPGSEAKTSPATRLGSKRQSVDAAYLRGLAERLMCIPVMHGTDQSDCDRLAEIAESLSPAHVAAVNSHNALVAALKAITDQVEQFSDAEHVVGCEPLIASARAALALANGKDSQ